MADSQYHSLQVRAKSNQVVEHHYDDQKPGKPLYLLIPGALIALGAIVLIILIAVVIQDKDSTVQAIGGALIVLLIPVYIGGVFTFSYGYELYDMGKAIRLTVIIVLLTLASVIMLAAVIFVLAAMSKGKSNSSSGSSSGSSSRSVSSSGSNRGGSFLDGIGPIILNTSPTRTVTREIVREVPVEPPAPQAIKCSHCGRSYVPEENKFACPNCGAPTPQEFTPQNKG